MNIKIIITRSISFLLCILCFSLYSQNTYYVSSSIGHDNNDGTTMTKPWKTINKVNNFSFAQGDVVKFKRGDSWREQIVGQSYLTYEDYVDPNNPSDTKPLFIGSINGKERRWYDESNGVWSTSLADPDNFEIISNTSFTDNYNDWILWKHQDISNQVQISIDNSAVKIHCNNDSGIGQAYIQFFTRNLNLQENTQYKLSFKVKKSGASFNSLDVKLMNPVNPWNSYSNDNTVNFVINNEEWETRVFYFDANTTASDARITFSMGNNGNNWDLFLDDISLQKMVMPTQNGELFSNSSFDNDINDWKFFSTVDADIIHNPFESSVQITCNTNNSNNFSSIQFYKDDFKIYDDFIYRLTFKAKSSNPVSNMEIRLMSLNNTLYSSDIAELTIDDDDWNSYVFYFHSNNNGAATNNRTLKKPARITFYLGESAGNWTLNLDDISLQKIVDDVGSIYFKVGNIEDNVFDVESNFTFGCKKPENDSLSDDEIDFEFYSEKNNDKLYLKSDTNPENISPFELALTRDMIWQTNKTQVDYKNLSFKFGGANGFDGHDHYYLNFYDCEFLYIGGGYQFNKINIPNKDNIRYGNGITFWGHSQNLIVDRCRFHQIYDGAVTNQDLGANKIQSNIIYRNNFISNCELPFAYWNNPENSTTKNIYFINNTSIFAGYTWAKDQRPDSRAAHIRIGKDLANINDNSFKVFIYNNILYESNNTYLEFTNQHSLRNVEFKNNLIFDSSNPVGQRIILVVEAEDERDLGGTLDKNWFYFEPTTTYNEDNSPNNFGDYNNFIDYHITGFLDSNAYDLAMFFNDPDFSTESTENNDFNIEYTNSDYSNSGYSDSNFNDFGNTDFFGNPRIVDGTIDIGCFENQNISSNRFYELSNLNKELFSVYPNPVTNSSTIKFYVPKAGLVNLSLIDFYGKELRIISDTKYEEGNHTLKFQPKNYSSGVYFLRLTIDNKVYSKNIIIHIK